MARYEKDIDLIIDLLHSIRFWVVVIAFCQLSSCFLN